MGVYTEKLSAFRIECVRHIEDVVKAKGIDENCERVYKLLRPISIYTKDETFGFRQESIVAIGISVGVLHFIRDQKHRRYYIINDLDDEELAKQTHYESNRVYSCRRGAHLYRSSSHSRPPL